MAHNTEAFFYFRKKGNMEGGRETMGGKRRVEGVKSRSLFLSISFTTSAGFVVAILSRGYSHRRDPDVKVMTTAT